MQPMSASSLLPLPLSSATTPAPRAAADAGTGASQAALVKAAEQFESLFIAQMFKQMRQAAEAFGDGSGDGAGQGASAGNAAVLDHAYWLVADSMSKRHAFGIADCLIAQMHGGAAATATATATLATPAAAAASPPSFDPSGFQP